MSKETDHAITRLIDYCEAELDFSVTLPLVVKPKRNSSGALKHKDCRDARLGIEVFNAKGDKVVQVRQTSVENLSDLALRAIDELTQRGFIK